MNRSRQLYFCIFVYSVLQSCWTDGGHQRPSSVSYVDSAGFEFYETGGEYVLAIHGGAGTLLRENMSPGLEDSIREALEEALKIGQEVLSAGGTSIEAVSRSITLLENNQHFNAGKGAVLNGNGGFELDASIMDGSSGEAGAVAGVSRIKNPILAARAVMDHSRHVLLSGAGADSFALKTGLERAEQGYFLTRKRYRQLQMLKKKRLLEEDSKYGTVGAVALDRYGNLAAGTSTGGMTGKEYNRIGDSPVIGAGTYADNETCAVSCTGHGEFFIRDAVAFSIHSMMKYGHYPLGSAAGEIVLRDLAGIGGDGGIIGVDRFGNVALVFNTPGMYRGYICEDHFEIKIFQED